MTVPQHRVKALIEYTRPRIKKGLISFLGAIGFYRRYIQLLAPEMAVLTSHFQTGSCAGGLDD